MKGRNFGNPGVQYPTIKHHVNGFRTFSRFGCSRKKQVADFDATIAKIEMFTMLKNLEMLRHRTKQGYTRKAAEGHYA